VETETARSPYGNNGQFETKTLNKKLALLKKYWYVLLAVVLVLAALIYFVASHLSSQADWAQAEKLYKTSDYAKIKDLVADKPMPKDGKRLEIYTYTMHATGGLDKALEGYKRIDQKNPSPDTKVRIANVYNQQKKYDQATEIYKQIINENPTYIQAYVNLATVQRLQAKTNESIKTAAEGVKNNPDSVTLHELNVSMLMNDKSSKDYKNSIEALKKLDPQNQLLRILNEG
jgi:tetratricopeptide (TPR) repeat protein